MNSKEISYSEILTYSVQDMGNSLGIIASVLERAQAIKFQEGEEHVESNVFDLLYEVSRVHSDLLQMYQLYQINHNHYQLNLEDICIYELMEEQLAQSDLLFSNHQVAVDIQGDEELTWTIDESLCRGLMNTILSSASRYTKSKIHVAFEETQDGLQIVVEDDSKGYPSHLFVTPEDCSKGINLPQGSVGLGIYYVLRVCQVHAHSGKCGHIFINNGGSLGGGVFGVCLPR